MNPNTQKAANAAALAIALTCTPLIAQSNEPLLTAPNDEDAFQLELQARGGSPILGLVDADGDGDLDFVSETNDQIRRNLGPRLLGSSINLPPILASTTESNRLAFGDFDQDGHVDMARGGIEIVFGPLLTPNGRRVVVDVLALPASSLIRDEDLQAIDLDADGDLDLVAVDRPAGTPLSASQAFIYLNDGTGSFSSRQAITPLIPGPIDFTPIQFDGNGPTELLQRVPGFAIALRSRNPDGTYTSSSLSLPLSPGELVDDLCVADMDGDGTEDLIVSTTLNSQTRLRVLPNSGGSFGLLANDPAPQAADGQLVAVDPDGDGNVDIAVTTSRSIQTFVNDGTGRLSPTPEIEARASAPQRRFGDIDGDGRDDFLLRDGLDFAIGFGQSDGRFGELRQQFFDRAEVDFFTFSSEIYAGDFNGDRRRDLVSLGTDVDFAFGRGTGDYDRLFLQGFSALAGNEMAVVTDLDGDGTDEITAFGRFGGAIRIDSQSITPLNQISGFQPTAVATIDADGDGDDEIVAISGLNSVVLVVPDSSGGLMFDAGAFPGPTRPSSPTADPTHLEVFDADGDGDPDVLLTAEVVTSGTRAGYLLLNNGGVFSLGSSLPVMGLGAPSSASTTLGAPAVGDFDGDSDIDLAYPGLQTQLLNDGSGAYAIGESAIPSGAADLYLAPDLDLDGTSEILAWSESAPGELRVFRNDGAGRFSLSLRSPLVLERLRSRAPDQRPRDLFLTADLDDDGDQDLIAGSTILLSTSAQLELRAPVRIGTSTRWLWRFKPTEVEGLGRSGIAFGAFLLSTSPLQQATPLGLGSLSISAGLAFASFANTPGGVIRFRSSELNVPAMPQLAGIEIYCQGVAIYRQVVGTGTTVGATNTIRTVILP